LTGKNATDCKGIDKARLKIEVGKSKYLVSLVPGFAKIYAELKDQQNSESTSE